MKAIYPILICLLMTSCATFSGLSRETMLGQQDPYCKVYNSKADFMSLTFGDFRFAMNKKDYRKLNPPIISFKEILFYAKTTDPDYDYYVLLNPEKTYQTNNKYVVKDTTIRQNHFVIAVSRSAPSSDINLIFNKIYEDDSWNE